MILIEIDKRLQAYGQLPDYTTVRTVEHTIPQTLDDAWKEYLGADTFDERLQTVVHTLGNLCLLSGSANGAAGQNPFEAKVKAYSPITALARQFKEHQGAWNVAAVRARSTQLALKALEVWPWAAAETYGG
jgi:hypothetical protein